MLNSQKSAATLIYKAWKIWISANPPWTSNAQPMDRFPAHILHTA